MNMRALVCLTILLRPLFVASAAGETIEALGPPVHFLAGTVISESFDGAALTRVVFPNGPRTFRYSPPGGWKIESGPRTDLTQGAYKASLTVAIRPGATGAIAAEAERRASLAELLPLQIAGQPVEKTSVSYKRGGFIFNRTKIRSLGPEWQVELVLEGPAEKFAPVEEQLSASLLSISLETQADVEARARAKEKQAIAQIARERHAASQLPPAGPVRGKLVE